MGINIGEPQNWERWNSLGMRGVYGPEIQAYMCCHVKCCGFVINGIHRNRKKSPKLGSARTRPGDFCQNFLPRVFNVPVVGLSLRIGHRCSWRKKLTRTMGSGPRKKFNDRPIFSRLDTIHKSVGRTDKRTDTGQHQRRTALIHSVAR